jgi:hypothetical protein
VLCPRMLFCPHDHIAPVCQSNTNFIPSLSNSSCATSMSAQHHMHDESIPIVSSKYDSMQRVLVMPRGSPAVADSSDVIFDSGAAVDCTGDAEIFSREPISGGPTLLTAMGEAAPTLQHGYVNELLEDVNFTPSMLHTIKSISKLDRRGDFFVGGAGRIRVIRENKVIAVAALEHDGLYHHKLSDPLANRVGPDPLRITVSGSTIVAELQPVRRQRRSKVRL